MAERRAHDATQRKLFAHREMLKMLVTGFLPAELLAELALDLDNAEQLKDTFVSESLLIREADVVWKIPRHVTAAPPLYICLLLEFQSSIDLMMPVRVLQYVSLIYESLAHRDTGSRPGARSLLPVLPVVLYNGDSRWRASAQVRDLIASPVNSALSPYLPTLRFILIDEGSIPHKQLTQINNLLAQLIMLENISSHKHIKKQVEHIIDNLDELIPDKLREDVALFISELLKPHNIHVPPHELLAPPEKRTMLADAIAQLKKQAANRGRKEGIKEGIKEGVREERRAQLVKLLGLKFGPNEGREAALDALSSEQLDYAISLIFSADSEQALLDAARAQR